MADANLGAYPPATVVWFTVMVDVVCSPLKCSSWREYLGVTDSSWLSYQVPPLRQTFPTLLSYQSFLNEQSAFLEEPTSMERFASHFSMEGLQSLYTYAFKTASTDLCNPTSTSGLIALFLLVLLFRQGKAVLLPLFSSWGRLIGRKTHGRDWEHANEERIAKFGEYVFRLLYHSSVSIYGLWYFMDKDWWALSVDPTKTLNFWKGSLSEPIAPGLAWYYLLQAAYNIDALTSLIELSFVPGFQDLFDKNGRLQSPVTFHWSENVRGDFMEMMIHHVVTNMLVLGSSFMRLMRVGSMVLLVHDVSDVPVDLSKLANFLKWRRATITCFFSMIFSWMFFRLYVFPFSLTWSVFVQSTYLIEEGWPPLVQISVMSTLQALLSVLVLLHFAWFCMFVRMLSAWLRKSEYHDYSEHKKGEIQDNAVVNTKAVGATRTTRNKVAVAKARARDPYAHEEKKDDN